MKNNLMRFGLIWIALAHAACVRNVKEPLFEPPSKKVISEPAFDTEITQTCVGYWGFSSLRIWFDSDSWEIRPDMKPILEVSADILNPYSNTKVKIEGYCDNMGSLEYNLVLSQKRAESIRRYLIEEKGISDSSFFTPIGFGELRPIESNTSEKGRSLNRYASLIFYNGENLKKGMKVNFDRATALLSADYRSKNDSLEIHLKFNSRQLESLEYTEKLVTSRLDKSCKLILELKEIYPLLSPKSFPIHKNGVKDVRVIYHKLSKSSSDERMGFTEVVINLSRKPRAYMIEHIEDALVIHLN